MHLSLHCIIFGFLVDFLDLVTATSCCESLVSKHAVDFLLQPSLLLLGHVLATVLGSESSFSSGLAGSFLSQLVLRGTGSDVSWKIKPSEVLGPPIDVEVEFESHVRGHGYEIILVVRGVNATNDTIGAQSKTFNLITAFNNVTLREQARHFEQVNHVEDNDGPSVNIKIER